MITDNRIFKIEGEYHGEKIGDVPAYYLLKIENWVNTPKWVKQYIQENRDLLIDEVTVF